MMLYQFDLCLSMQLIWPLKQLRAGSIKRLGNRLEIGIQIIPFLASTFVDYLKKYLVALLNLNFTQLLFAKLSFPCICWVSNFQLLQNFWNWRGINKWKKNKNAQNNFKLNYANYMSDDECHCKWKMMLNDH